jgi:2-C-methyl-D-erythritol 4-phosphate cytidylyltransferase
VSAPANVCVVIPAAGLGERLGLDQPKAFVAINNWSLLSLTIRRVLDIARVGHLIVAVPADFKTEALEHIDRAMRDANKKIPFDVVVGGETRTQSVKNSLLALDQLDSFVLVHDAARPFVPQSVFESVIGKLDNGAKVVIPVIPVSDTIKTVNEKSEVINTLDRTQLRAVQTPQGFAREVLSEIYATTDLKPTTDDAGLAEIAGINVSTVAGSVESFKVTTPFDLEMATNFMNRK